MKQLFLSLVLLVIFLSCEKRNSYYISLDGDYDVVGVSKAEKTPWQEFDSLGYMNHGENPFTFENDSIVRVNNRIAQLFFTDSVFRYQLTDSEFNLYSKSSDLVHKLTYDLDGNIFNVNLKNQYCRRIQLIPAKSSDSEE